MDAGKLSAINAYRDQLRMMQNATTSADDTAAQTSNQPSFAKMVGEALGDSANTIRQADATEMQSLSGKVDLTDLVTAVSNAELTLSTVVAVRDRVIGAYQDILRMSI